MKKHLILASCTKEMEELLFRRLDDLSPSEQRVLEDHLISCPTCTSLYKNFLNVEASIGNLPLLQPAQALSPELLQSKQKHKLLSGIFRYGYALPQVSQFACASIIVYDASMRHLAKRYPGHRVNGVIAIPLVVILLMTVAISIMTSGVVKTTKPPSTSDWLQATTLPANRADLPMAPMPPRASDWLQVTTLADSGPGSLRMAISSARPGSTITFDANLTGMILLKVGTLSIAKSLTIRGPDEGTLTISGRTGVPGNSFGVQVGPGSVVISNLHFMGLSSISNFGTLTLMNSTISGNTGGGIANFGTLSLTDTTVSNNTTASDGGGIANFGTLSLTNSTISNNVASGNGGGIYSGNDKKKRGSLTLINGTIADNTALNGGGIAVGGGTADITFCTIYKNEATTGGGISTNGSQVTMRNSIVAENRAHTGPDISGMLTSNGHNLIQQYSGVTFGKPHELHSTDILGETFTDLGIDSQPGDHGGSTQTYSLLPGSPASDRIPLDACHVNDISTDQRGVKRPDGNEQLCDIGAYESMG